MRNKITLDAFLKNSGVTEKISKQTFEILPQLPQGWKWKLLKEVGEVVNGFGFPLEFQGKVGLPYGFVKVNDMNLPGNDVCINHTINTVDKETLEQIGARLYPPGTIIFPKIGGAVATNKKRILGIKASFDNNIMGIIPKEEVHPKWLYFFLCTIDLMALAKTTTMPSIRKTKVEKIKVPVPSLDVQRRVVARLEEITARIEQAKKLREEALKETEKIMQTALHQIFSKAVEKGWGKKKLESIAFIRKGTINPMDYPDEEFELYSIPAYHTSVEPEIKKGCEIKSSKVLVNPGDCLFGKLNPHVPKIWLVKPYNNRRQIATTEFFPIVSKEKNNNEKWFIPEYIYYVLKSPDFQKRVIHKILGTTASRQRLSPNDILEEEIPLPPFEEQKLVVEHLNRLEEKIRKLKRHQQEVSQKIEKITNAVLEKAFSGRL
jgi:type I restriction enzyme S subunit